MSNQYFDFIDLSKPYFNLLQKKSYLLTRDKEDAEDLFQETMLKAYKSFLSKESMNNIKAWLFTIMLNAFRSNYRRKKSKPEHVYLSANENYYENLISYQIDFKSNASSLIKDMSLNEDLLLKFESIPEKYRQILFLANFEKKSYKDISIILELPMGTVMSRLHRAKKCLQKKFRIESEDSH